MDIYNSARVKYAGEWIDLKPITPRQSRALKTLLERIGQKIDKSAGGNVKDVKEVVLNFLDNWHLYLGDMWDELHDDLLYLLSTISGISQDKLEDTAWHEHIQFILKVLEINEAMQVKKNLKEMKKGGRSRWLKLFRD